MIQKQWCVRLLDTLGRWTFPVSTPAYRCCALPWILGEWQHRPMTAAWFSRSRIRLDCNLREKTRQPDVMEYKNKISLLLKKTHTIGTLIKVIIYLIFHQLWKCVAITLAMERLHSLYKGGIHMIRLPFCFKKEILGYSLRLSLSINLIDVYMWPNTTKGTWCLLLKILRFLHYLTEDFTSFPMIPNS